MALDQNLVNAWLDSKRDLDIAKATELELRNDIVGQILTPNHEGAVRAEIEDTNDIVTATGVISRRVDEKALALLKDRLGEDELECIKYVPQIVVGKYKKLEGAKMLRKAVVAKPGQSQLKFTMKPAK